MHEKMTSKRWKEQKDVFQAYGDMHRDTVSSCNRMLYSQEEEKNYVILPRIQTSDFVLKKLTNRNDKSMQKVKSHSHSEKIVYRIQSKVGYKRAHFCQREIICFHPS
jgi:hypothetical protein